MKRNPPIPAHPSLPRRTLRRFARRFRAVFGVSQCGPAELGCAPGCGSFSAYSDTEDAIIVILTRAETPAGLRRHLMHASKVCRGSSLPSRSRLPCDRDREALAVASGSNGAMWYRDAVARAKARRGWA